MVLSYYVSVRTAGKFGYARFAHGALARALCGAACLALGACAGSKGPSNVKSASAYRADLYAATENINAFLSDNTPENTLRDELQQAVGELAHAYPKIAAAAAPLQGKTGDPAYGAVAIDAEDGVIVAGNLASALAADPAKHANAVAKLEAAIGDWVAYNEGLERDGGEVAFNPTRWWEAPAWRDAMPAGPSRTNDGCREESSLSR